jgi:hypothetical protein
MRADLGTSIASTGLSDRTLQAIENQERDIMLSTAFRLAQFYGGDARLRAAGRYGEAPNLVEILFVTCL